MSTPLDHGIAPPDFRLPAGTHLGTVRLQVADLARSLAYYTEIVGLRTIHQGAGLAELGAFDDDRVLIVLQERRGAAPAPPRGRFGLFHVAILLPDRPSLGRLLRHLAERHARVGMSDHEVSEALYLTDPDGLGLEIYADRPRDEWRTFDRQLAMGTEPLDVRAVLATAGDEPWRGAPAGTTIGHVHLHVGDLDVGARFYHETLGFDKTVWAYPGALFLAADGYHHHLGTNTWARGAMSARDDEARLLEWTIEVPGVAYVAALERSAARHDVAFHRDDDSIVLQDPWGTVVRVRATAEG